MHILTLKSQFFKYRGIFIRIKANSAKRAERQIDFERLLWYHIRKKQIRKDKK